MSDSQSITSKSKQRFKIMEGDAFVNLQLIKAESIDTVFTSPEPPYNYDQMLRLQQVMLQLPRILKPTGSIWINLGDQHNEDGVLALIPERFVIDMVTMYDWKLRNSIIWDRSAKTFDYEDRRRWRRDHEYLYWFVMDVKQHHWEDISRWGESEPEPDIISSTYYPAKPGVFESGFPKDVIWDAIAQTTPEHGRILDPFCGTGTTGVVALENGYEFLGIEANPNIIPKINQRLKNITY